MDIISIAAIGVGIWLFGKKKPGVAINQTSFDTATQTDLIDSEITEKKDEGSTFYAYARYQVSLYKSDFDGVPYVSIDQGTYLGIPTGKSGNDRFELRTNLDGKDVFFWVEEGKVSISPTILFGPNKSHIQKLAIKRAQ